MSRIWLAAAVLLVLAGWLLTGSPALAAPPTLGIEFDTVGPGESLTVEVDLVDLETGDSWELNIRRESDDGLASACHGEGMGVETELGADDPLVFTMETSPNCPVVSYYFELRYTVLLDGGLWSIPLALRTHEAALWALWTSGTLVRVLGAIETGQCDNIVSVGNLGLSGFAGSGSSLPYAGTRAEAERLRKVFTRWCGDHSYEAASEAVERDWKRMVTFYDYPKEHWRHIRTTNPVESPFAALRLRTDAARRYRRADRAIAVKWKMLTVAEQRLRRLKAPELMEDIYLGVKYVDGIAVEATAEKVAA